MYSFFSGATKAAARAIRSNSGMMRKVYVPKYMYPLASVTSNFITFLISLIVLVGVAVYLQVPATRHLVEALLPLIILFFLALGVGMILATLEVFFRDLEYLWGVVLMLIMYCCAIFYPTERLEAKGFGWIFDINPLYALIKNFRNAVLYGIGPDVQALIYASLFAIVSLGVGTYMFYKKQDEFILYL